MSIQNSTAKRPGGIGRKLALLLTTVALAAGLAPTTALAVEAESDSSAQLAAATTLAAQGDLTSQSAAGNTTRYYAKKLKLGKGVIGTFESRDDSNTNLYDYWYKFKTSNRWSVYSVKVESIDGRQLYDYVYDADGNEITRNEHNYTISAHDITGASRNNWYYIKICRGYNGVVRYDQFKITATEHPYIKTVTGVKSAKTTKSSIALKWNKQANATKYQVKWKKKGGSWKTVIVKGNSKKFTSLKKGSSYQFKVRAYCKKGYSIEKDKVSNWSNWSTVKKVKTKK